MPDDLSEGYRLPVRRQPVTITYADGAREEAVLFCEPGLKLEESLETAPSFVPIEHAGRVRLVARRTLAVVSAPTASVPDDDEVARRCVQVVVRMGPAGSVEGQLTYVPRLERPRTLDFLNGPSAIIKIADGERAHLVYKEHIAALEER